MLREDLVQPVYIKFQPCSFKRVFLSAIKLRCSSLVVWFFLNLVNEVSTEIAWSFQGGLLRIFLEWISGQEFWYDCSPYFLYSVL